MTIMAITLHQPWASLIAVGHKQLETRDWNPKFRGPLVIHAGKTLDTSVLGNAEFMRFFHLIGLDMFKLPLAAALCICDLHAVYRTEDVLPKISDEERMFGNFQPGRSAWHLKNVRMFEQPIAVRGQQGLWKWTLALPEGMG